MRKIIFHKDNKVYSNMKEKTPDFLIQLFFMRNRI